MTHIVIVRGDDEDIDFVIPIGPFPNADLAFAESARLNKEIEEAGEDTSLALPPHIYAVADILRIPGIPWKDLQ